MGLMGCESALMRYEWAMLTSGEIFRNLRGPKEIGPPCRLTALRWRTGTGERPSEVVRANHPENLPVRFSGRRIRAHTAWGIRPTAYRSLLAGVRSWAHRKP